ncbi:MAG: hypothetical protein HC892_21905 [Saprospiraceae bacterium]|nr:hypothetical protein [Saprospiraceae bacterium]
MLADSRSTASPKLRYDFSGKFWIFPISSFPYALMDKLNQMGISQTHEIWYIAQGADPICTPHLFAYNFYRLLKNRISEYFLYPSAFRVFMNRILAYSNDKELKWTDTLNFSIESLDKRTKTLLKLFNGQLLFPFCSNPFKVLLSIKAKYISKNYSAVYAT